MRLCVLASGSAGNCSIVQTAGGTLMIDAGIGPRVASARTTALDSNVVLSSVSAICLTHLDRDHFNLAWVGTVLRRNIVVHCHRSRVSDLLRLAGDDRLTPLVKPFGLAPFLALPGVVVTPIPLAHDGDGSHGFVVECGGKRLGLATDLGHVPGVLIDAFCRLDWLAIESNYDPAMQHASDRPDFLKRRIMGGAGHLSNEQAWSAVQTVLQRGRRRDERTPHHIVLLHRSRQCNCPVLLRSLFSRDPRIAAALTLAEQDTASGWLSLPDRFVGEQLTLGW